MVSSELFASPPPLSQSSIKVLSSAESLAVAEIFINAALACICHKRKLLPWGSDAFHTRYVDDLQSNYWKHNANKYATFCDTEPSTLSSTSQQFRVLVRSDVERGNSILDLIEPGVLPAIRGGFLETVRFFITQGNTDCQITDVLESYSLDFTYEQDMTNGGSVRSISFNSAPVFTTENAIKSFKKAIKSLLTVLEGLPSLPRRRRIGVAVLYNDRCPNDYKAPKLLTERVSSAAHGRSGWLKLLLQKPLEVGTFEVGPYHVAVGARTTAQLIELSTSSQLRDYKTRMQLQGWQKSSSQQENSIVSTIPRTNERTLPASGRSPQGVPSFSAIHRSQQSSATGMTRKSRKRNVKPTTLAELILKACNLETEFEGDHVFDMNDLKRNKITRLHSTSTIRCGCGDESRAENPLICTLCGTSQHVECYGWNIFPRAKLPDEHFCYSCLLLPREIELAAEMPALIHKRLALAHIQENNPTDVDCLMKAMHLVNTEDDYQTFNTIMDSLQQHGFLARNRSMIDAAGKDLAAKVFRDFISPIAQISHHFVAIKDDETASGRANAIAVALQQYTQGRPYLPNNDSTGDGQQLARESDGEHSQDHLIAAPQKSLKRKGSHEPDGEHPYKWNIREEATSSRDMRTPLNSRVTTPVARIASHCERLVCLDRSSPSTVFPLSRALDEAVGVASSDVQWEGFERYDIGAVTRSGR